MFKLKMLLVVIVLWLTSNEILQCEGFDFEMRTVNISEKVDAFVKWSSETSIWTKALTIGFNGAVLFLSIISNTIIIQSVRINPDMQTTTNYIIVNMACADLFYCICGAPYTMHFVFGWYRWFPGRFGKVACIGIHIIQLMIALESSFSLVVVTFDRFMAVISPLKYKSYRSSCSYLIVFSWVSSLITSILTAQHSMEIVIFQSRTYCMPLEANDTALFMLLGYILPLICVVPLCFAIVYKLCSRKVPGENGGQNAVQKTSKRVTFMIICVVLAFNINWVPIFIADYFSQVHGAWIAMPISYTISYLNGTFNLAIYYIFSERFRTSIRKMLTKRNIETNSR